MIGQMDLMLQTYAILTFPRPRKNTHVHFSAPKEIVAQPPYLQSALQPAKVIFAWPVRVRPYVSHRLPDVPGSPPLAAVLSEGMVEFSITGREQSPTHP